MAAKKEPDQNEYKLHYDELRNYFEFLVKWTIGAIGIILAAGGLFLWSNIGDLRKEITTAVASIEKDAKSSIEKTRSTANSELDLIRNDASQLAKTETYNKIDEEFKKNNIEGLISAAADRQVDEAVKNKIAKEVDRLVIQLQDQLAEIQNIADMISRARIGLRSGLTDLKELNITTKNNSVKQITMKHLKRIANDYDSVFSENLRNNFKNDIRSAIESHSNSLPSKDSLLKSALIEQILNSKDLYVVGYSFLYLRKETGINFEMFDFDSVQKFKVKEKIK